MFVYKHTETVEYVKIQTLRENNSIIFRNKNAKFSGY